MAGQVYNTKKLELNRVVFLGRTWEEYLLIFDLKEEQLIGKSVLDCPGGACSFTAIANQRGIRSVAADLAYYHSVEALKEKGLQDIEYIIPKIEQVKDNYRWDYFENIVELKNKRVTALSQCIKDMEETNKSRYFPVVLPVLPFEDGFFDITLSAHLLFMYADNIDYYFHIQTIDELLRVTKEEVRIFPITDMNGKRYDRIDEIKEWIVMRGWEAVESKSPYEFHKNVNTMLKIRKTSE